MPKSWGYLQVCGAQDDLVFFFSHASGLINGKVRETHQFWGGVRAVWWLSPWSIYGAIYGSLMEWRTKPPGHLGHSLASVPFSIPHGNLNSPEHFPSHGHGTEEEGIFAKNLRDLRRGYPGETFTEVDENHLKLVSDCLWWLDVTRCNYNYRCN